jgi:hypothetical protein
MKIGRQREQERSSPRNGEGSLDGREDPEPSRKDIVAIILAMFQLFFPLVVALIIVGAIVALILR